MKRTTLFNLSGVLALVLWTGCSRHEPTAAPAASLPAAPVRVHRLELRETDAVEEAVGTVQARRQARLEAKVPGRVAELAVAAGQKVRQGEILVRLEVIESRARLEQAQAVNEQAQGDLKRITSLLERQAATPAEFDAVQARARSAAAAVKEVTTLVAQGEIMAPFDGVVSVKSAEVGDLAVPGKALLELEDPASLRLEVHVGESLVRHLKIGDSLVVRFPALDQPIIGVVSEMAPAADPGSRTFLMKLDLPPSPGLRSGGFARVDLPLGKTRSIRVPAAAVIQRGQLEFVFIVADGHAQLRLVKSGRSLGAETELQAGAAAGESVVTEGAANLRDGQPIVVQP